MPNLRQRFGRRLMLVFVAGVLQSPSNGCAIPLRVLLLLLLDRSRISRALCHGSGSCLRGGSRDASPVCLRGMRVLGAARHPLDKRSGHFISWGWQRRCQNHRSGTAPSSLHPVGPGGSPQRPAHRNIDGNADRARPHAGDETKQKPKHRPIGALNVSHRARYAGSCLSGGSAARECCSEQARNDRAHAEDSDCPPYPRNRLSA